jgi:hypothetical protein
MKTTEKEKNDWLQEICANCGCVMGSHHGGTQPWPLNYCPDPDETMDWEKGPGTIFKPTGKYRISK